MTLVRLRYQTIEFGDTDIHLRTLRDNQQFNDGDGIAALLGISSANWPLFGVVWPSAIVLARHMLGVDVVGKRILEVGCGIGLTSLLLNHRAANITATDYHPEADAFLQSNARLNNDAEIPFLRTGWGDPQCALGQFDLVIGSDLLYEAESVNLLSSFIDQHAALRCEVLLVDPGRGNHARFSRRMVALGYCHRQFKPVADVFEQPFSGQILCYSR
jgi:ETFB lysine methyltransferase